MKLSDLIVDMTNESIPLHTHIPYRWSPLWRILSLVNINGKWAITNRPF